MYKPLSVRLLTLTLLLLVTACGGGDKTDTVPQYGEFRPAVSNSAYKDDLVRCATIEESSNACHLNRLPFIGQETNSPTKANIMARVIVSHTWMAGRFSELLDEMPDDIYQLFGGVTAIVIGADIRPSYYWAVTGAIYLDPADLWLTSAERNTISKAPDYRSEFARELAFSSYWRYVQGNNYAWNSYSLDGNVSSRPISEIVRPMAALLFHELAHANDFIPPVLITTVNPQNTPLAQAIAFENNNISVSLANQSPLTSVMLYGLAQVMFRGEDATDAQKMLDAETVGLEFGADGASDTYAYSSRAEDTAMLFEEVMMKYHFDVDRELAFTDAPFEYSDCSALIVRWGKRNRIGEAAIKARAEIVVQQLLDRNSVSTYFADIPDSTPMINGVDWCNNLAQFGNANPVQQKMSRQPIPAGDLHQQRHPGHTHPLH
jgi:hypothetical protein